MLQATATPDRARSGPRRAGARRAGARRAGKAGQPELSDLSAVSECRRSRIRNDKSLALIGSDSAQQVSGARRSSGRVTFDKEDLKEAAGGAGRLWRPKPSGRTPIRFGRFGGMLRSRISHPEQSGRDPRNGLRRHLPGCIRNAFHDVNTLRRPRARARSISDWTAF
jgi:hypothetical protein